MPELLSPAGNFEKMKAALRYGADAVYLAGNQFGMRAAADNFSTEQIYEAVDYAHARSKKVYLAVNVMPHWQEYEALEQFLDSLSESNIDAIIAADAGVIEAIKAHLPNTAIHLSTQASTVSHRSCDFWQRQGVSRIVLARELPLAEIRQIRARISSELELEAFIHGSMCISYSGRCLLSQYFSDRDANRGKCTQPCRWGYRTLTAVEEKRPDAPITVEEHDGQSIFFASKDLCMIEHMADLMESGIDSFKIEGRMKSAYYAAVTANTYRMAMDAYCQSPSDYRTNPAWLSELESVSHREYCTGFFYDRATECAQLASHNGYLKEKAFLACATADAPAGTLARFVQRNKVCANSQAELLTVGQIGIPLSIGSLYDMEGNPIESAPHPSMEFQFCTPIDIRAGDILRGV